MLQILIELDQPVRDAAFFSRASKSLRSTLDLSSSRTRFISSRFSLISSVFSSIFSVLLFISMRLNSNSLVCLLRRCLTNCISSAFLPTCSNVLSNFCWMPGMASTTGLNSLRMASISAPTSVGLNLSSFLTRFFMRNIIMEGHLLVKAKSTIR